MEICPVIEIKKFSPLHQQQIDRNYCAPFRDASRGKAAIAIHHRRRVWWTGIWAIADPIEMIFWTCLPQDDWNLIWSSREFFASIQLACANSVPTWATISNARSKACARHSHCPFVFSSCRLVRHFFSRAHRSDVICCSKEQVVSGVECDGKISRIVIIIRIVWLFIFSSFFKTNLSLISIKILRNIKVIRKIKVAWSCSANYSIKWNRASLCCLVSTLINYFRNSFQKTIFG